MISVSELVFLLLLRKTICICLFLQAQTLRLTAAVFPERAYHDKNKSVACSYISSEWVSESLLVVSVTSFFNGSISMLKVLEEGKERKNFFPLMMLSNKCSYVKSGLGQL